MATAVNPQFERSFATLAYAFLQEKAQKLLDHLIGFQVIEKNDKDTRAAGAFGFKIGEQWLYAPVFFINGDLKGHDVLYLKTPDLFIPMQENWVNFILSHDTRLLGQGEQGTPRDHGTLPSDLRAYYRSPLAKSGNFDCNWGEETAGWLVGSVVKNAGFDSEAFDVAPLVAALTRDPKDAELDARLDLRTLVKDAEMANALSTMLMKHKTMRKTLSPFYSGDDLVPAEGTKIATAIKPEELEALGLNRGVFNFYARDLATRGVVSAESEVGRRVRELLSLKGLNTPADVRNNLPTLLSTNEDVRHTVERNQAPGGITANPSNRVSLLTSDDEPDDLTDKEAEALMLEGYDIRDSREKASEAYSGDALSGTVFTPDESGVYTVLLGSGDWKPCMVIVNPRVPGRIGRRAGLSLVVYDKNYALVPSSAVVVSQKLKAKDADVAMVGMDSLGAGGLYMFVSKDKCDATVPCTYREKHKDGYAVEPRVYPTRTCSDDLGTDTQFDMGNDWYSLTTAASARVRLILPGNALRPAYGMLMVPDEWQAVGLESYPNLELGSLSMATDLLLKRAELLPVTVARTKSGYTLVATNTAAVLGSSRDVVWELVNTYGLRKSAACEVLAVADSAGTSQVLIKRAANYYAPDMSELDNNAAYSDELGYPVQEHQKMQRQVSGLEDTYAQPQDYEYERAADETRQAAEQASQAGEKEIMDVGVLASLVGAVDVNRFNEKYLKDLMRGLDRVGRLLFLYYWHYDKYADRYGAEEMEELESALQNTFKSVGDTVLFLKKKMIEPDRLLQGADVSLDSVSGTGSM
jgi:hypothetical protein